MMSRHRYRDPHWFHHHRLILEAAIGTALAIALNWGCGRWQPGHVPPPHAGVQLGATGGEQASRKPPSAAPSAAPEQAASAGPTAQEQAQQRAETQEADSLAARRNRLVSDITGDQERIQEINGQIEAATAQSASLRSQAVSQENSVDQALTSENVQAAQAKVDWELAIQSLSEQLAQTRARVASLTQQAQYWDYYNIDTDQRREVQADLQNSTLEQQALERQLADARVQAATQLTLQSSNGQYLKEASMRDLQLQYDQSVATAQESLQGLKNDLAAAQNQLKADQAELQKVDASIGANPVARKRAERVG